MENGLVAQEQTRDLAVAREPQTVLAEAHRAAQALKDVIAKKEKPVKFNGEQYLEFEDWQTVGKFYGLAARSEKAEPIEINEISGFRAAASVIHVESGKVVGGAEAYCMKDEPNWTNKPLFQLASMAQTRACAKALSNILRWVPVLAGYKGTPAEEMEGVTVAPRPTPPTPPKGSVNRAEFVPSKIEVKTTANGKPYWIIHDNNERYRTFDATDHKVADGAMKESKKITVEFQAGKFGNEVKFLSWADPAEGVIMEQEAEIVGE